MNAEELFDVRCKQLVEFRDRVRDEQSCVCRFYVPNSALSRCRCERQTLGFEMGDNLSKHLRGEERES